MDQAPSHVAVWAASNVMPLPPPEPGAWKLTTIVDHNDIRLQSMESDGGKPYSQVNDSSDTVPVAYKRGVTSSPNRSPHPQLSQMPVNGMTW